MSNHFNICKPPHREAVGYAHTLSFLRRTLFPKDRPSLAGLDNLIQFPLAGKIAALFESWKQ